VHQDGDNLTGGKRSTANPRNDSVQPLDESKASNKLVFPIMFSLTEVDSVSEQTVCLDVAETGESWEERNYAE
jgi:hypothetical protein